ncbi:hypothetical protein [Synechococcus sp. NOUM97013]|uniref:hypothetical protein n=1 Tax=Synechococcus sp. NOUM97013 TaxID=1442555 RepID=UPI00351C1185
MGLSFTGHNALKFLNPALMARIQSTEHQGVSRLQLVNPLPASLRFKRLFSPLAPSLLDLTAWPGLDHALLPTKQILLSFQREPARRALDWLVRTTGELSEAGKINRLS